MDYSSWGLRELDMTEQLTLSFLNKDRGELPYVSDLNHLLLQSFSL